MKNSYSPSTARLLKRRAGRLGSLCCLYLVAIASVNLPRVSAKAEAPSRLEQLLESTQNNAPNGRPNSPVENNPDGENEVALPSTETSQPAGQPTGQPTGLPQIDAEAAGILSQAAEQAAKAELLATTAASAADWDGVMVQWLGAIALAQSIEPESPSRIVAQRQLRSYVQSLQEVQRRTEQASPSSGLPSFGSDLFDAQLEGYLSYVATVGTPDILIVGSSRALQGIDPKVMQQRLSEQGYGELTVFNFSVNGATAQVVNFVLADLLPQPLPAVIVWGDGSRAFNDGRRDRTWESLITSPGYQTIQQSQLATTPQLRPLTLNALASSEPIENDTSTSNTPTGNLTGNLTDLAADRISPPVTVETPLPEFPGNLNALGFSAVGDRFAPQTYYQQFPQVRGRYDGAYSPFTLNGPQTEALADIARVSADQNSQLIFVNLPLSDSYLDADRLYYESQFQQFLQAQSNAHGFEVIDWLRAWQGRPELFADPSHINQEGAAAIATQLAQSPTLRTAIWSGRPTQQHTRPASPFNSL
ncbi:MAG: hypothetical protein AAFP03_13910 [Cyanobacteria bacterium J06598_3]